MCLQLRAIYLGLKGWGSRSGFTYSLEYGCAVDESTEDQWNLWRAEHPKVTPYRNKGWSLYDQMDQILGSTAKPKGNHTFTPHRVPSAATEPSAAQTQEATATQGGIVDEAESPPLSGRVSRNSVIAFCAAVFIYV